MNKKYYAFRRPNGMTGHKFTDDVALCKATTYRKAKKIFSKYYADIKDEEVILISGVIKRNEEFIVLTDY